MKNKVLRIFLEAIPTLIMIALITIIGNDYILASLYLIIIGISLFIKHEKHDYRLLILGFVVMIIAETIFISTGVEIFLRNSLFGIMPLWLPILWAYAFVAIKRGVNILR